MSWFDDQLRQRESLDEDSFRESLDRIAGAVMGKRTLRAMTDHREAAGSALDEILRCFHCRAEDVGTAELTGETLEEELESRLRPLGIQMRAVKLEPGWYRDTVGPMIGLAGEKGLPVALLSAGFSGYRYTDPETGKKVRLSKKTEQTIAEDAICFYPAFPQRSLKLTDLLLFMKDRLSAADILAYIGMMAVMALVGLLSPMFVNWLFGDVLRSGSVKVLAGLASFMLAYSLCRLLLSVFQSLITEKVRIKLNVSVEAAIMGRVIALPASFFRTYASGDLARRVSYFNSLCGMLMDTIANTGLTSVFSIVYIGQIFAFAPALVVPAVLITLVTIAVSILTTLTGIRNTERKMMESSKTGGMTYAMINGIQKTRLAGAEKRMFARWGQQYAREVALTYHPPFLIRLGGTLSMAISLIGTMILYAVSIREGIGSAQYYAFTAAYGQMSSAFLSVTGIAATLAQIKPTLKMAKPIMEAQPENSDMKTVVKELRGGIELSHVSFRYDEEMPWVIDDLSLKIAPGEYVAITGPTGCGKSTLLRLLLGFEKPQKGSILYDRTDISRADLRSLRSHIGTVMQDSRLFPGDIYSNIVISAPQLTRDQAWKAAELAAIADDIRAMPMGMNTLISEGQGGISGGQKQRLMIARALAPEPKILIFDEATSALDNVTQKKVSDAIDGLHCTRIAIAHRLSTICHCDRILVIDKGKIIEEGKYEDLIAKNGFFAELVAKQRLS